MRPVSKGQLFRTFGDRHILTWIIFLLQAPLNEAVYPNGGFRRRRNLWKGRLRVLNLRD